MKSLACSLLSLFGLHKATGRKRRSFSAPSGLEQLESRQLMSVTNALVQDGTLMILSDDAATAVTVSRGSNSIRVTEGGTGRMWSFSVGSVRQVEFHGGEGNDRFVNNVNTLPSRAYGNGGNDELRGSGADDILEGGAGNDRIFGRGGDDEMAGGEGADFIHGGAGNNSVIDRESIDRVFSAVDAVLKESEGILPAAEEFAVKSAPTSVSVVTPVLENGILVVRGTDNADNINLTVSGTTISVAGKSFNSASVTSIVIVGERGDDIINISESIKQTTYVFAGAGNDTVNGGGGTDYIHGASGNDTLNGRSGNDAIWGGSGVNVLNGGTGTNELYQRPAFRVYTMNAFELEIARLTNLERTKRGLPALIINTQIALAANQHATQMATRSAAIGTAAAHNHNLWGVKLPTVSARMEYAGYEYSAYRENIAFGYPTAAAVVNGWMNSTGHRENILATNITHFGVSAVKNAGGTLFYCQNFAKAL